MSSKTTKPTDLEIAEFNFKVEVERARLMLDIASITAYIEGETAERVREAALQQLDQLFHPAMQIVTDGQG